MTCSFRKYSLLIALFHVTKIHLLNSRNLTTLVLGSYFGAHFDKFFINCQNLEDVRIDDYMSEIPSTAIVAIKSTLKSNRGIQKLSLCGPSFFEEDFSTGINFSLKELSILYFREVNQENLISFLKTQQNSLETLTIDKWKGEELTATILSMPRLRKLTLFVHMNSIDTIPGDCKSNTIVDLHVTLFLGSVEFENFLKSFPKVERLKISQSAFTNEIADSIPEIFKCLKRLFVQVWCATTLSNEAFFMNLDRIEGDCVELNSNELFQKLNGRRI